MIWRNFVNLTTPKTNQKWHKWKPYQARTPIHVQEERNGSPSVNQVFSIAEPKCVHAIPPFG